MPELAPYLRALPAVTPLTRDVFDGATAERRLASYFAVSTTQAFGALTRLELTAAAACITYVERTQLGQRPPLSPPVREREGATLAIDQATRVNLELTRALSGERRGSLLAAIDRTVTPPGARLLAQRLAAPLTDPARDRAPARRGRLLRWRMRAARGETRERLKAAPDLARALARLVVGRGGPRDLAAIRDGIAAAAGLAEQAGANARAAGRDRAGRRRVGRARSGDRARARPRARRRAAAASSATAASCARATRRRSTRRGRCATNRAG